MAEVASQPGKLSLCSISRAAPFCKGLVSQSVTKVPREGIFSLPHAQIVAPSRSSVAVKECRCRRNMLEALQIDG